METHNPQFVGTGEPMVLENHMFCGISIPVFRTVGDPGKISGWTNNPRTELIVNRWRRKEHIAPGVDPDDDVLLSLMLLDDDLCRVPNSRSFDIIVLGGDIKRNGIRLPLIVTWDGRLIDGNRRKFASKWALSTAGGATDQQRLNITNSPMLVLPENTSQHAIAAIVREMNYAHDLKLAWGDVVTNKYIYDQYQAYYNEDPSQQEIAVRRRVVDDFPMFSVTEIAYRIQTWELTQQFRADYGVELTDDELDGLINQRFQQFRQAHDTYKKQDYYDKSEFRDLLFEGIRHGLFPSFASVRKLGAIYESPKAQKIFCEGIGLPEEQRDNNFDLAVTEAHRDDVARRLPVDGRIRECIQFLDGLTSAEIAAIPIELIVELCGSLETVIAQAQSTLSTEIQGEAVTV